MKRLFQIGVILCALMAAWWAFGAHTDAPINIDRVVTGSNNYGTDPNSSKDISLANDEYIDNSVDGKIDLYADTVKASAIFKVGTTLIADKVSSLDSLTDAVVAKSTLKVIGATTLSNVSADSITSAVVLKSTAKVIGATTLSNVSADSISADIVLKGDLKFPVNTDTIKGDFVVAEDSVRIYKDAFAKWVPQALNGASGAGNYNMSIQCGTATPLTAVGKDTIVFHAAYANDPIVILTPAINSGVDTVYTWSLDSVGLTAAYFSFREISPLAAGGADTLTIKEAPARTPVFNWISIGK